MRAVTEHPGGYTRSGRRSLGFCWRRALFTWLLLAGLVLVNSPMLWASCLAISLVLAWGVPRNLPRLKKGLDGYAVCVLLVAIVVLLTGSSPS
jgi:hypothetical protein